MSLMALLGGHTHFYYPDHIYLTEKDFAFTFWDLLVVQSALQRLTYNQILMKIMVKSAFNIQKMAYAFQGEPFSVTRVSFTSSEFASSYEETSPSGTDWTVVKKSCRHKTPRDVFLYPFTTTWQRWVYFWLTIPGLRGSHYTILKLIVSASKFSLKYLYYMHIHHKLVHR